MRKPFTAVLLCLLLPTLALGGEGYTPPRPGTLFASAEVATPSTMNSRAGWKTFAGLTEALVQKVAKTAWDKGLIRGQWTLEDRQCAYAKFGLFVLAGMLGDENKATGPGMDRFYKDIPSTQKWVRALKKDWCRKKGSTPNQDENDDDDDNDDPGNKGVQLAVFYVEEVRKAQGVGELQREAAVKAAAATTVTAGLAAFFAVLSNILIPIPGVIPASPVSPPPGFN
ncbi:hypothetical protein CYFUS_006588 [Cystobacter fuscus]|uniref:Uncharacterized protein n=1 Tax=Cystobacter fuscus TaxID=43 RepID=A0A250JD96_9BACT|nr:hypothetical protein [Cystobacter fuscus]ATB41126.1 hypothetical protein CYFUS_006588 [Cystobacter fuscus]